MRRKIRIEKILLLYTLATCATISTNSAATQDYPERKQLEFLGFNNSTINTKNKGNLKEITEIHDNWDPNKIETDSKEIQMQFYVNLNDLTKEECKNLTEALLRKKGEACEELLINRERTKSEEITLYNHINQIHILYISLRDHLLRNFQIKNQELLDLSKKSELEYAVDNLYSAIHINRFYKNAKEDIENTKNNLEKYERFKGRVRIIQEKIELHVAEINKEEIKRKTEKKYYKMMAKYYEKQRGIIRTEDSQIETLSIKVLEKMKKVLITFWSPNYMSVIKGEKHSKMIDNLRDKIVEKARLIKLGQNSIKLKQWLLKIQKDRELTISEFNLLSYLETIEREQKNMQ